MSVAVALWSVVVQPGKKVKFLAQGDIRITNASLGDKLADESSRTSVKFTYNTPHKLDEDDEEVAKLPPKTTTVLCSLTPGKIEQALLDLVLEEEEEFEFELVGKNAIHLSGNYIDQNVNVPLNDEDDSDMDEDDFDLRDVSSDVEIDPNELDVPSDDDADRFEEIVEETNISKSNKRALDADAMEVEDTEVVKTSKKDKKKNKKLKGEDGQAIPSGAESETTPAKVNGEEKKKKDKKKKDKKDEESPSKDSGSMKELPGGTKYRDPKVGTGRPAKSGDTVSMRYVGKLESGAIFDSNTKGKPFTFHLGRGEVIKGWDEGIVGMQAGGERLLIVPAKLAYGNKKQQGIPAGSTLKFECKLLEIK